MSRIVTLEKIVQFQDALIEILEVYKDGDLKAQVFIDSYKSQIESLKKELVNTNDKFELDFSIPEDFYTNRAKYFALLELENPRKK